MNSLVQQPCHAQRTAAHAHPLSSRSSIPSGSSSVVFPDSGRQTAIDIPYIAELFLFEGFVEFCSELIQCWPYFQLGDL